MKITVWNIVSDKGIVLHNHIENGWSDSNYPTPIKESFSNQKAWKNIKWVRKYAHLVNGVVIHI